MRQPGQGGASPRAPQDALALRRVEVVRTYLELDSPAGIAPPSSAPEPAQLVQRRPCPVDTYRRLYKTVGERWYWHDRLEWSDEQLAEHLALPSVAVWELLVGGSSAGFFELQLQAEDNVEIVYFGLIPGYMGRGLGRYLLDRTIEEAFAMGARRIWLHTCTLDSERALPNYKARGFREFRTERLEVEIERTHVVGERQLRD